MSAQTNLVYPKPAPTPENVLLVSDGVMTVVEAAEFAKLGKSELYLRMERGELVYVKIGRRRLIPRKALLEMMAANVVKR